MSISNTADVARAVLRARRAAASLGMDEVRQVQLGTAVSELATNVLKYAGAGRVEIRDTTRPRDAATAPLPCVEVRIVDRGPGIADLARAEQEHFSSSATLGLGLSGARRLVDDMRITTAPGHGTDVVIRQWA